MSIHETASIDSSRGLRIRRVAVAAAVAIAALAGSLISAPSAQAALPAPKDQIIQRILADTNAVRAEVGLSPLVLNPAINTVAENWSKQQAANGAMSHNPNYAAQMPSGWRAAAENVAYGYRYTEVVAAWKASAGHYKNMTGDYTDIGIGIAESPNGTLYYTQNFGRYPANSGKTVFNHDGKSITLYHRSGIVQTYLGQGGSSSSWGWPETEEICTSTQCYVQFENGIISWISGSVGLQSTGGALFGTYLSLGGVNALGLPTAPQRSTGNGDYQSFQKSALFARSGSSPRLLSSSSGITARYLALGGPSGSLGWPTGAESCTGSSCGLPLENGQLTWSASTGVFPIIEPVLAQWSTDGGLANPLGTAKTNLNRYPGTGGVGYAQDFVTGYYYAAAGTTVGLRKNSGIFQYYSRVGSQYSVLGWPTSTETCGDGACWIEFQSGTVVWSPNRGTFTVMAGGMLSRWEASGATDGALGAPASERLYFGANGGGYAQIFAGGYTYESAAGSAAMVADDAIYRAYSSAGSQMGRLGWPVDNAQCSSSGQCVQRFQGGSITSTPGAGAAVIRYS